MNSVADVWDNVLSQLKGELSETTIATWFDELEAVDIQGNTFILHCSNDFKKGYIESLFMKNIKASLHDIFSTDFEVKILDDLDYAELKDNRPHRQSERFTSAEFTFETFVVGPSNKLAYAASVSVAEHPAQNYNPLLIYGDSGLGKTHLLHAICTEIRRRMGVARTPTASSQNAAANPAAGRRTLNTPSTHSGTAMGFSSVALLLNRRSSCPTAKRSSAVTPKYTAAASAVRFAA